MPKLFVYGTLMHPEIFWRVTQLAVEGREAIAMHHDRLRVRGENYPGMVRKPGAVVPGLVLDISPSAWVKLDAFEGDEYIRRPLCIRYPDGSREQVQGYLFRRNLRKRLARERWESTQELSRNLSKWMKSLGLPASISGE